MRRFAKAVAPFLLSALVAGSVTGSVGAASVHQGIAVWGEPALPADFRHLPDVNPDAPKGGSMVIGHPGSFDSLNDLILRGVPPTSITTLYDTLMVASASELGAAYPLIARSVEIADDRSWAVFAFDPKARFHDGAPITAEDAVFTWDKLREVGNPFTRSFLEKVTGVAAVDPLHLRITLSTTGEMKPIIDFATTLAPRPRHWWMAEGRDIGKTTLEPPLGSGPYAVAAVDPGRSLSWRRVPDYWGRDLPVNRGMHNLDDIRFDYYRDEEVLFEALKSGAVDLRWEFRAQRWTTGYDFPAFADGRVVRAEIATKLPLGAQGFHFNTRRPIFADARVREAMNHLFDFPWIHKQILHGQYLRTKSNFPNSEYGASGPPTPAEIAILRPFADRIDPRALTEAFDPPGDTGDGRSNLRAALRLFREAGWEVRDGVLTNTATNQPFTFEFVDDNPSLNRIIEPYVAALKRAGIAATIRQVDTAQMRRRLDEFDFDVTTVHRAFFPPPGTELMSYFGSATADTPGSANLAGVRDPVVDALIAQALTAREPATIKAAMRALDRVLLWKFLMVPHWYNPASWLAWWDRYDRPRPDPAYDLAFRATWMPSRWWAKP